MQTQTASIAILLLFVFALPSFGQDRNTKVQKTVLVHYMPWFSSKPVSGAWGWHWTMKNCDPDKTKGDRRVIASHYYPTIGPYDSNDPDVLECQVLLMKFAGIDGVVIDWYGIEDHWDYAANHRNSLHLVEFVKKAGLSFAVCYEDQTIQHLVDAKIVEADGKVEHGKKVLQWLSKNWFSDEAYIKLDKKPVLLVFGPQGFEGDQLKKICNEAQNPPVLFALPHLSTGAKADGSFGWPPVDGGKKVEPETWKSYLDSLEQRKTKGELTIPVAFPQFHDFYKQGEGRDTYGSIDHREGKTFDESLAIAMASKSPLIQIATWNDYGEGTMIEPTREFGYQFLEAIQAKRNTLNSAFPFSEGDLRLPIELYELRKQKLNAIGIELSELEKLSDLLFAGKCSDAKILIDRLRDTSKSNR